MEDETAFLKILKFKTRKMASESSRYFSFDPMELNDLYVAISLKKCAEINLCVQRKSALFFFGKQNGSI